jgi:acyl carrier protein
LIGRASFDTVAAVLHIAWRQGMLAGLGDSHRHAHGRSWLVEYIKGDVLVTEDLKRILGTTLQLGPRAGSMSTSTPLLGAIPELDSMAVVTLITALEEQFGITVDDDEIDASTFETLGSLVQFVEAKMNC